MIDVGKAIEISSAASREHPCRVIVVVESDQTARTPSRLPASETEGPSEVLSSSWSRWREAANDLDTLVMRWSGRTPVVAYWPNLPGSPASTRWASSRSVASPTRADECRCGHDGLADVYRGGIPTSRGPASPLAAVPGRRWTSSTPRPRQSPCGEPHPSVLVPDRRVATDVRRRGRGRGGGRRGHHRRRRLRRFDDGSEVSLTRSPVPGRAPASARRRDRLREPGQRPIETA